MAVLHQRALQRRDGLCQGRSGIARRYVELWGDGPAREQIWGRLEGELELTIEELVLIGGGERLLDSELVLQASIDRRNPAADPLSFVQVELMRRLREAGDDAPEQLRVSAS